LSRVLRGTLALIGSLRLRASPGTRYGQALAAASVPQSKGVTMGVGKKAKNKAKKVKGKTKKDARKVKHKGKKAKHAAKH
jgi:hypothetical protein